ncbi:hypothetical protein NDU88_005561 [Pleurodeles waltl]|uniref:Uncharacterized protein n=1 Tax=Pleurodeles waltl TaxID=8319 RepID=A0AAV7MJR8_PLEWA|nr:hypothetical protein NDU88_005561 [Pleurodeles waltl]
MEFKANGVGTSNHSALFTATKEACQRYEKTNQRREAVKWQSDVGPSNRVKERERKNREKEWTARRRAKLESETASQCHGLVVPHETRIAASSVMCQPNLAFSGHIQRCIGSK